MTKPGSTERTTLKRQPDKASDRQSDLHSILDDNLVAHVGVVIDSAPLVIPMAYGRSDNVIYLHGSSGSRLMRHLANEPEVCVSITELNALKVARSTFNSGMHYRAVMIFGKAKLVPSEERQLALDVVSNALIPGRVQEARPTTNKEVAATLIMSLSLDEASVKIAVNEVDDPEEDLNKGYWAGTIPLNTSAVSPIPADEESRSLPVPESVKRFIAKHSK
ncbi:MAG: pyridoxamine 5'-phosphate oxidase family protein [Aquiluna sp.]|nr:pyridoxamine 5'-phosphate oxidase family protein [Aquiluna sp.]